MHRVEDDEWCQGWHRIGTGNTFHEGFHDRDLQLRVARQYGWVSWHHWSYKNGVRPGHFRRGLLGTTGRAKDQRLGRERGVKGSDQCLIPNVQFSSDRN